MNGPYPPITAESRVPPSPESWETIHGLLRGQLYQVVKSFTDADNDIHPVGEEWIFLSGSFSKFDDEISIEVGRGAGDTWIIPLVWKPERHEEIIEHIETYLKAAMRDSAIEAPDNPSI